MKKVTISFSVTNDAVDFVVTELYHAAEIIGENSPGIAFSLGTTTTEATAEDYAQAKKLGCDESILGMSEDESD